MEPQKPENSQGPGPEVLERRQRASGLRLRSWTVLNVKRDALIQMAAGKA